MNIVLEILNIFPRYLAIITIVLVIIPTFVCGSMRISLYKHLRELANKTCRLINGESRGIQPKFLTQLEIRFSHASKQLEEVNSLALIDGVYSQEMFQCFRFNLFCENGEHITKTLPNLLLAFGLLGTFIGITSNLYNISQIINQTGSDITDLTNQLQTPLQSMGIAFITSLIALLCSSCLTAINLKFNTNLAKNKLLTNLEDYLDNIYKPQVEGDTRLDKAVNRMVDQQQEFLLRFHEKVGEVLEQTFAKAANRIADDNQKAQKLATEVYEQLFNASSAINHGAMIFKDSMVNLESQVNNLQTMLPILKTNIDIFQASSTKFMDSAIKIENSRFSENIESLMLNLANIETRFSNTTNLLDKSISTFVEDNQKATESAQQVYQQLFNASSTINNGADMFKESMINLENQVNNLQTMLPILKTNIDVFQVGSTKFMDSAIKIENMKLSENLETITLDLSQTQIKFTETTKLLAKSVLSLTQDNKKATELAQQVYQQFKLSSSSLEESSVRFADSVLTIKESKFNEHLIDATANLATIQEKFNQMAKTLTQIVKPIEINLKTLELSTDKMVSLSQNITNVSNNVEQINSRYVEMSKLSKEILVKEGEISIELKNNFREFIKSVTQLEQKLQQIIGLLENNEREFVLLSQELTSKMKQDYE